MSGVTCSYLHLLHRGVAHVARLVPELLLAIHGRGGDLEVRSLTRTHIRTDCSLLFEQERLPGTWLTNKHIPVARIRMLRLQLDLDVFEGTDQRLLVLLLPLYTIA